MMPGRGRDSRNSQTEGLNTEHRRRIHRHICLACFPRILSCHDLVFCTSWECNPIKAPQTPRLSDSLLEDFVVCRDWLAGLDDVIPNGRADQFWNGVQIQLGHDVRAVGFHRLDGDLQCSGNFLVGSAFRDELRDLAFARSDWAGRSGGAVTANDLLGGAGQRQNGGRIYW